jgi:NhaC family Na+:H+ antiporter
MANTPETSGRPVNPSYADAIVPLVTLIVLIAGSVYLFGFEALDGPLQVALVVCSMVAGLVILRNGHSWEEIAAAGRRGLSSIVSAIFILLGVGALIGTWNMSGTIPTLVYYGIQWIDPDWYYLTTALICAAVSLSIGSSWTTAGTIGVGLVGIASLLGVSPVITAGAVISGAYLGDKTSPLSETTVLASQLVEANLYTHIRAQVWTSLPAFLLAVVVFALLGLGGEGVGPDVVASSAELGQLDQLFWITPLNLIPLLALLAMSLKKSPSSLAIMAAALFAGVLGAFLQPEAVQRFLAEPELAGPLASVKAIWKAMATGYEANSGLEEVDALLSRGGMDSMLKTIWLIIVAVNFGTLLEEFGLLAKLIDPVLARARTTGRLFATTAATALGLNIVAADQYIALVLPARMFKEEFARRGLAPENLSRAVADAGTVTSPLVPWNSCGAYMSAVLGVPTLLYLPFCIFNIVSPILTTLYGATGFRIARLRPEADPRPADTAA